jgi:hypothetical protein
MILRGKVSNIGAPVAYSAWNLPPSLAFTSFVSNPPAGDSGLGLRVRPSPEEVSALVASPGEIPDDERQVHFEVPLNASDAEISAMLDTLAEDSSDAAPAEHWWWRPSWRPAKLWTLRGLTMFARNVLAEPINPLFLLRGRKRKRDVFIGCLAWIRVPVLLFLLLGKCQCLNLLKLTPMGATRLKLTPNGCDPAEVDPNGCTVRVVDEDDEEEDEVPLIRKNSRRYIASGESSGVPSPALSALIGLQELSLANFDQTLEDMVPEDLLSEPVDGGATDACADVLDAGLGSSRAASCASSTLERGLEGQEAGLDCTAPMEVTEGPSALEVAAAENFGPQGWCWRLPSPRGCCRR